MKNIKFCQYCGKELEKDADRCPMCSNLLTERINNDVNVKANPKKSSTKRKEFKIALLMMLGVMVFWILPISIGVIDTIKKAEEELNEVEHSDEQINTCYGFGESFIFDNLAIKFKDDYEFITVEDEYPEYSGKSILKLPLTITNLSDEDYRLNILYYNVNNSLGTSVKNLNVYFDNNIDYANRLKSGESYTKYMYFIYENDEKYVVEFKNTDELIKVELPINKNII